jgi:hypothetical protein
MLKIQHPAALVRDREKRVSPWESVRLYRYANGVELQILVGSLPHGELQSAISANRPLTIEKQGQEAIIAFGEEAAPITDFLGGDRLTGENASTWVLDSCRFLPSVDVKVRAGVHTAALAREGDNLVATFEDGTRVEVEPHGGHGHVHAQRDGKALKCFFNGAEDTLYVLGEDA